jgi:transposase
MSADDTAQAQPSRMAEVLKLSLVEGLSVRAISRKLSMSRKTVRRILGRTSTKPKAPRAHKAVLLSPFEPTIRKLLDATPELKAPAVLERLRPLGYAGGLTILREHLRQARPGYRREAFLTLDFKPGAAVQVDWADFGFALPGCPRRVSAFVMALCYSRYLYLEFVLSQALGTFLRCMERGLRFYGGTTTADMFDNMKTVVLSHTPHTTVFNPRFLEYARVRGFAAIACNVARGNEKGRVERPIGFVRTRFWPGRRFQSLLDLNTQATAWRDEFANNREHEETGKVPFLVFKNEEQPLLKPLSQRPFETDEIETAGVTKSFRVRFDKNLYSMPPRLVGQTVVVRANDFAVTAFLGPKQVALHRRAWGVGEDIEHDSHRQAALETKPRAEPGRLPPGLEPLGEVGREYFKVLAATSRSLRREVVRLTFLAEVFGERPTASAIDEVMKSGHVGAEYVEYVLRHRKGLVPAPNPLRLGDPELDAMSFREPDLSAYDTLVPASKTLDPGQVPPPPKDSPEGDTQ